MFFNCFTVIVSDLPLPDHPKRLIRNPLWRIAHPYGAAFSRLKRCAFYRTPDQVVRSHLLYPAELRMRNC